MFISVSKCLLFVLTDLISLIKDYKNIWESQDIRGHIFAVNVVPVDGRGPYGSRASADTVVSKFGVH